MTNRIIYTRKIREWVKFSGPSRIICVMGQVYNYADVEDVEYIENTEIRKVEDYVRSLANQAADGLFPIEINVDNFKRDAEILTEMKAIFKMKDGNVIEVDFLANEPRMMAVGNPHYNTFKQDFEDLKRLITILKSRY